MIKPYVIISFFLSFLLCLNACNKEESVNEPEAEEKEVNDTIPDSDTSTVIIDHTSWTYNQNIYEVNVRQYTHEGTFAAFSAHLPRLQEMGVGVLWFMPIHPIGVQNRLESLGSYYSVKDYEDVNSEFGTKQDFIDLVENAHNRGMYVIVDWVANHTSWDNPLTISNKDFYLLTADGNFQPPPGTNWSDVIQLDYSNEDLQGYMIETLKGWINDTDIDGFRFDYVDGIPTAFWNKVTQELKQLKPDVFLIAEGDGIKYHNMGFDMDYNWTLYGWGNGLSKQIFEGTKTTDDLEAFLDLERFRYMPDKYHMYFTSNHDENSWQGTVFEQLGESAELFAVLTQTLYGMPMVYSGQEAGLNKRLKFFSKDEIDWSNMVYADLYGTLNNLRDTCQALWLGGKGADPVRVLTDADDQIFAYSRQKEGSHVLVFLNLSENSVSFTVNDETNSGSYSNIFESTTVALSSDLEISIDAWDFLVLVR
ncbi:MAG: alpha-amylase family glycosyl hydrolase [Salinivirgaceae bacterium]|jgi:glycosidase|nr:alpha-amylase family glycosyl hydrolase [Salinivirgaceae bacterium]